MSKHYYNNGKIEKVLPEDAIIPEGFIKGRLASVGKNISKVRKGFLWYNNGINELYLKETEIPPLNYNLGRLERTEEWCNNLSKSRESWNWYTDGINDIIVQDLNNIPEGFYPGRINLGDFGLSNKNTNYYNDGEKDLRINEEDGIPTDLIKGRISNKGKSSWCKGLTSENDDRVKARGKSLARTFKINNVSDKIFNTRKKNNTLNTSKLEEVFLEILINNFGKDNIETNYNKDPRYPFHCDFYIKSLDLFIELNQHFTHGNHPFNPNNKEDLKLLEEWELKSQTSNFYKNAIYVWTDLDVRKITIAKQNKLNYLTFYNIKEGSTTIENMILEEISKFRSE